MGSKSYLGGHTLVNPGRNRDWFSSEEGEPQRGRKGANPRRSNRDKTLFAERAFVDQILSSLRTGKKVTLTVPKVLRNRRTNKNLFRRYVSLHRKYKPSYEKELDLLLHSIFEKDLDISHQRDQKKMTESQKVTIRKKTNFDTNSRSRFRYELKKLIFKNASKDEIEDLIGSFPEDVRDAINNVGIYQFCKIFRNRK